MNLPCSNGSHSAVVQRAVALKVRVDPDSRRSVNSSYPAAPTSIDPEAQAQFARQRAQDICEAAHAAEYMTSSMDPVGRRPRRPITAQQLLAEATASSYAPPERQLARSLLEPLNRK
jgi:hypothetical protein